MNQTEAYLVGHCIATWKVGGFGGPLALASNQPRNINEYRGYFLEV